MDRLSLWLGAALTGLVLLSAPAVLALPKYRLLTAQQVGHDKGDPLWQLSGRVVPCVTCHLSAQGGPGWNPFGESLRAGFRAEPGARFGEVLYRVLEARADADGDAYPDALEFHARTNPGDAASRPEQGLDVLQAEFEAAGGLEQYAPRTR
ncbi:hypothetical protein V3W47_16720 [Deinococcus sp. YIM 134068]|uniref:hypothetical protein n=1 Tax=Deinococcus lichenicola TaxID=3118910 RepID=UPI002F92E1D6